MKRPTGMTIVEALIGILLFAGLIGVVMQLIRSSSVQEKQLMEMSGLQREARKGIEVLQRDIRGMSSVQLLRRREQGRLDTLVMLVPTSEAPAQEVRYAFNPAARQLTRNGETVLSEALQDVQIWPFDSSKPPVEVVKPEELKGLSFFKVRITLARSPGEGAGTANGTRPTTSGAAEPLPGSTGLAQRIFDFLVYPRLPTSIRKAKESRLNQSDSRFAPGRIEE